MLSYENVTFFLTATDQNGTKQEEFNDIEIIFSIQVPNLTNTMSIYLFYNGSWIKSDSFCKSPLTVYDFANNIFTTRICHMTQFAMFKAPITNEEEEKNTGSKSGNFFFLVFAYFKDTVRIVIIVIPVIVVSAVLAAVMVVLFRGQRSKRRINVIHVDQMQDA